jgi:hypothetical protein
MAKKRRALKEPVEDYIALITHAALSYGINHYHHKLEPLRPYSRTLRLHGRAAYPAILRGLPFDAHLYGRLLDEEPRQSLERSVGVLNKRSGELEIVAEVPIEFIVTLSTAFHDGRLSVVAARGSKLSRGTSLLTSVDFENRAHFEDYWGEPISDDPG